MGVAPCMLQVAPSPVGPFPCAARFCPTPMNLVETPMCVLVGTSVSGIKIRTCFGPRFKLPMTKFTRGGPSPPVSSWCHADVHWHSPGCVPPPPPPSLAHHPSTPSLVQESALCVLQHRVTTLLLSRPVTLCERPWSLGELQWCQHWQVLPVAPVPDLWRMPRASLRAR
jgi:hypothetical protein